MKIKKYLKHTRYGGEHGSLVGECSVKDSTEMKKKLIEINLFMECPGT